MSDELKMRVRKKMEAAIWASMKGCDCPFVFSDGKIVSAAQRCTAKAVRCNGRLSTIQKRLKELETSSS